MPAQELVQVGRALADPTRAGILTALLDGRALTGRELAAHVGVAPSTMSEHLGKLLDAGFVAVEAQGRHRYWRLAGAHVAQLLEHLGASAPATPATRTSAPAALVQARTCYDHLAGRLAVVIFDRLLADGDVGGSTDDLGITSGGAARLHSLGVDVDALPATRPAARACLDWTERTHHLAGAAGAALLQAFLAAQWLRRGPRPRHLTITTTGRRAFGRHFGWGS